MDEILKEIDRLDQQIISLIGDRYTCIKAIAKFKNVDTTMKDQPHYDAMLETKHRLAVERGLDPDMIEGMWRVMTDWLITEEKNMTAQLPFDCDANPSD